MRVDKRWVKQRVTVSHDDWTPIVPPMDFDYLAFRCDSSALLYRTDVADEDTEDSLAQYAQDGVTGSFSVRYFHNTIGTLVRCRFQADVPVCYVKSVAASAVVVVTWIL